MNMHGRRGRLWGEQEGLRGEDRLSRYFGLRGAGGATAIVVALLVGVFVIVVPATSQAQVKNFTTSHGHQLELPPIANLDCSQMRAVLKRIDRTNYRSGGPTPANDADMPLFQYENDLAAARYRACSKRPSPQSSHGGAFSFSRSN